MTALFGLYFSYLEISKRHKLYEHLFVLGLIFTVREVIKNEHALANTQSNLRVYWSLVRAKPAQKTERTVVFETVKKLIEKRANARIWGDASVNIKFLGQQKL